MSKVSGGSSRGVVEYCKLCGKSSLTVEDDLCKDCHD